MDTTNRPATEEDALTRAIIGCAHTVSNILGVGFVEKVYENALVIELRKAGLQAEPQKKLNVFYDGLLVGEFQVDILVNEAVILELKAAKVIDDVHRAQLLNYLKASGLRTGLILNFGTPRLDVKRMVR
jgi:GxxExxY protein